MTEQAERRLLPGVSVLTTTYNRADVLGHSIDSVLAQDSPDWELVIVDNGSTDGTQELLATYHDDRIRVIRVDPNRGCTGGRNVGLDNISREWFTFLDSDDEMLPNALSTLLAVPETIDASIDAVECNCVGSETGAFTGHGLHGDQWLDQRTVLSVCHGEFWGITKTSLLDGYRFNPKIQIEALLWFRINQTARRYYIHKGLKIYHTERTDTETFRQEKNLASRHAEFVALLDEEMPYLEAVAGLAPRVYSQDLFHIFRVFLASGDLPRARGVHRELWRRGLWRHRVAAQVGLAFGPWPIDMLRRARDIARRYRPRRGRVVNN